MSGWKISLWAAIVFAALYFLYSVRGILLPFILAIIISALLDPLIRKLRLKGLSRGLSVALVFSGFFGAVAALVIYLTPLVTQQFSEFGYRLELYLHELARQSSAESVFLNWNPVVRVQPEEKEGTIDRLLEENRQLLHRLGLPATRAGLIEQYVDPYRSEILNFVKNFFSSFFTIISSFASQILFLLLTPILVFLILMDIDRFKTRYINWIPPAIRGSTASLLEDIGKVFLNYLRGVGTTIVIYILCATVLLALLGTPYYVLLAILAGALYLIPYIGAWISAATIFLVVGLSGVKGNWLITFDTSWIFAFVTILIFLVCSSIFDQLIYPRLVGRSVGLHPVVSMFVIFSGGALFGLMGMIIAFPLAGAIKVILERLIRITSAESVYDLRLPAVPLRHRTASEL